MLEPEDRTLFLDALRPPVGFELDRAVGTTYTLDLTSLLAAPLGFALFDRESGDGRLIADPIALIEAVRRYSDRITVFCQAGQIAIPREYRGIFAYLERSVVEVVPPVRDAIFHPKVWLIRYVRATDGARTYRMLCLSRNLTFDRAWDTMLRLDGEPGEHANGGPVADFIRGLPALRTQRLAPDQAAAITSLADDLEAVTFEPPAGFDRVAFWPMGMGASRDPLASGRIDRLLVVSPFLTAGTAETLSKRGRENILVSRPAALDAVGRLALRRYAETLTLSPIALTESSEADETTTAPTDEAIAERPDVDLRGLHAKLYVADAPYRGHIWTGSANATSAAFESNVEFLVELEGRKAVCGVDAILGAPNAGVGLRKLLEAYEPISDAPRPPDDKEHLERRLDLIRRRLSAQSLVLRVSQDADLYGLTIELRPARDARPDWWQATIEDANARVRPLTLPAAYSSSLERVGDVVSASFGSHSFDRLTSFCVVDLELEGTGRRAETTFVVNAELVGAPEDRRQRMLVTLLENRKDLIRFLLLLLGQIGADDLSEAIDVIYLDRVKNNGSWVFAQWQSLFEPMVRALAVEPTRLDEIDRLIKELQGSDAGRKLLPPGWREVWEPIWKARQGGPS